jgi:hypothetical protein
MPWLEELRGAYQQGQLCLFVGAGVSMSCGLPSWKGLAHALARSMWQHSDDDPIQPIYRQKYLQGFDPLESLRYTRRTLGTKLGREVARNLYSPDLQLSKTVRVIASMKLVRRICCFNYDDILEAAFEKVGREFRCVVQGDEIPFLSETTLIFHPHGYLPRRTRLHRSASKDIVLSEDDYYRLYSSPHSWANIIQISLLLNYRALFVGCSLADPNLRRILDVLAEVVQPAHTHYALLPDPGRPRPKTSDSDRLKNWYWMERAWKAKREVLQDDLASRGIEPIWWKADSEVAERLEELVADNA